MKSTLAAGRFASLSALLALLVFAGAPAWAQPAQPETPPVEPVEPVAPDAPVDPETPADPETPVEPATPPLPVTPPVDEDPAAVDVQSEFVELRVHVITTSNVYESLKFDIFSVTDRQVVARGQSGNEAVGEPAATFELIPGIYKIVKAGENFDTLVDFATVTVDQDTDFVIVLDADTGAFRGSGVVTDDLPEGTEIAGVRFALNVGGTLWLNHRRGVVGNTNGVSALVGLFGNFGMVYDKGSNFLTVNSKMQLNLQDPPTAGAFATTDFFEASALYAYNINNPYVGPYARAGMKTRIFPGYLYLADEDSGTGQVVINRLDGTTENLNFGTEAHPDDLRLEIAKPFAPFILQEEIGANLKAVDLDLKLLELTVATRIGWALRQGITNGLLVVQGDERGSPVELDEVDDYFTNGPLAGGTANLTFARWLFGQAEIAALAPVQDRERAGNDFASRILLDASGTAGLKFPALTSMLHASFDYTFRLQRDGFMTGKTMFDQIVMARVSLQLF